MDPRRAEKREPAILSVGLHGITLVPALLCLGSAGAEPRRKKVAAR